jgi:hypothetical protein
MSVLNFLNLSSVLCEATFVNASKQTPVDHRFPICVIFFGGKENRESEVGCEILWCITVQTTEIYDTKYTGTSVQALVVYEDVELQGNGINWGELKQIF